VRDRRRQRSKACDPCYVCQFRSDLPSISSTAVLCHVLSRADVYQSTLSVSRSVTDQVQIFDRVVGHLQPVFVFKIATDARARSIMSFNIGYLPDGLDYDQFKR